jgi:nicotinamide mononucleotide (NMN) deamidase PncC
VWMAIARRDGEATAWRLRLPGDRSSVRGETVRRALAALRERAAGTGP